MILFSFCYPQHYEVTPNEIKALRENSELETDRKKKNYSKGIEFIYFIDIQFNVGIFEHRLCLSHLIFVVFLHY